MNPVRVFALLGARVPPADMQPGATGSPEIDVSTAAALCAGMPEHWMKAARFKWTMDATVYEWLRIELWRVAMEKAQKERWQTSRVKLRDKPATLAMAEMALYETALPGRMKPRDKMEFLGVKKDAWNRTWEGKYEAVYSVLNDWTACAFRHAQRRQVDV